MKTVNKLAPLLLLLALPGLLGAQNFTPTLTINAPAPNGIVGADGELAVFLKLFTWDSAEKDVEVRCTVANWSGESVAQLDPIPVKLKGEWVGSAKVNLEQFGPYTFTASLYASGSSTAMTTATRRFVKMVEVPVLNAKEREKSFVGVNTHAWANWKLLSRLGIHWARDYAWNWVGKGEKGAKVNGEDFHQRLKLADEAGLSTLACIQKTFVTPDKRKWMEDGEAIETAFARVATMFPELDYIEIGNEEESGFPDHAHEVTNYANFVQHAGAGTRKAGTGAKLVLSGDTFVFYDTVKGLIERVKDDFGVVNYHYYSGTVPPEHATSDINDGSETRSTDMLVLDRFSEMNRMSHAAGKEVWLTETGWDVTYGPAVGERLQAVYLPRMYLISLMTGVDKIFWYFDIDQKGTIRFSSCGLVDLDSAVRPSGVALAALSKLMLGADYAGSVWLGDSDIWCPVWKMADGSWMATVWSILGQHPAAPEFAKAKAVYDMFGNKGAAKDIGDEVQYLAFDQLPAAWAAQRKVELVSRTVLQVPIGGVSEIVVECRDDSTTFAWENLPASFRGGKWAIKSGKAVSGLACAPDAKPGHHELVLVAQGKGWVKKWKLNIEICPPVVLSSSPYLPGSSVWVDLKLVDPPDGKVSLSVPKGSGVVEPAVVTLSSEAMTQVRFTPAAATQGAVPLSLELASGAKQTYHIRPGLVPVLKVEGITLDGKLEDWPEKNLISRDCFTSSKAGFYAASGLGWTPEGIYVCMTFPSEKMFSADPTWFWNYANAELFFDSAGSEGNAWTPSCRQFWLYPVEKNGQWRLKSGEWKTRENPPGTNLYDDKRTRCAMSYEQGICTMEAFIPAEALGKAPSLNQIWSAALCMQTGLPSKQDRKAAWPRSKSEGNLDRPAMWGKIQFVQ